MLFRSAGKNTAIFTDVKTGGIGNGGDIDIRSGLLSIINGAQLQASNSGQGNGGNVNIRVAETVNIAGQEGGNVSQIRSSIEKNGIGNAGSINIDAGLFFLKDGAQIRSTMFGRGNAGNIRVNARDTVSLSGNSTIVSTTEIGGVGKSGNIDIKADSVLLQNDATLTTSNRGQGDAGNVTIVSKNIYLAGEKTFVSTGIELDGIGRGGDINIQADNLSLTDGALLLTFNNGLGNSGDITVKVIGAVNIVGTQKSTSGGINSTGNQGNGGNILVEANSLSLRNGASFLAANFKQGNAGSITIKAADYILLSGLGKNAGRGLFVTSVGEKGITGNIVVSAPQITIDNISVNADSISGNGGNISIGNSFVTGTTGNSIPPITNLILLRNGSLISTNALERNRQGRGIDGGNINLSSALIIAVPRENSDITANANGGKGGNVGITAQGLLGTQFRLRQTSSSDITASSEFGQNGIFTINSPGIDPGKDTSKLPTRLIDASKQITQRCSATQEDSLHVTGRGGHPASASELPSNDVVWIDPRIPQTQLIAKNSITQQIPASPQPAVGWSFSGQGKVTLLAASNQGTVNSSKSACPNTTH